MRRSIHMGQTSSSSLSSRAGSCSANYFVSRRGTIRLGGGGGGSGGGDRRRSCCSSSNQWPWTATKTTTTTTTLVSSSSSTWLLPTRVQQSTLLRFSSSTLRVLQRPVIRIQRSFPLTYSSTSASLYRHRNDNINPRCNDNESTTATTTVPPPKEPPVVAVTPTTTTTASSSDPPIWTWVDQWVLVPLSLQPYAKLARMDKPIGTMLLVSSALLEQAQH
jgi:hypothetical protein